MTDAERIEIVARKLAKRTGYAVSYCERYVRRELAEGRKLDEIARDSRAAVKVESTVQPREAPRKGVVAAPFPKTMSVVAPEVRGGSRIMPTVRDDKNDDPAD